MLVARQVFDTCLGRSLGVGLGMETLTLDLSAAAFTETPKPEKLSSTAGVILVLLRLKPEQRIKEHSHGGKEVMVQGLLGETSLLQENEVRARIAEKQVLRFAGDEKVALANLSNENAAVLIVLSQASQP